jgi:hypothetical protein
MNPSTIESITVSDESNGLHKFEKKRSIGVYYHNKK